MSNMDQPQPTSAMDRLVRELSRLPGLGKRSAERITFHLLRQSPEQAEQLANALLDLKRRTKACHICGHITDTDPCTICADRRRDHGQVLVVEQPAEVITLEATGQFRGVYHVLMGRLAPLDGVGPGQLNIDALIDRRIREVIIGTNPTLEGDGTALYLADALRQAGVKVTRLARGLPSGATIERLSKAVLVDAIAGRVNVTD